MKRYYTKTMNYAPTTPFDSSEEAWLWCCLCESLGNIRGQGNGGKISRPCESSDIMVAVKRLLESGKITPEHAQILSKYGREQTPPHQHFGDSLRVCSLWSEAMNFLGNILKQKGIVG